MTETTGKDVQNMFERAVVKDPAKLIDSLDPGERADVLAILAKIKL